MPINHYCVFGRRGNIQSVQVLVCPTEEGMSVFSKEATASALAIDLELQPAFAAKGEDPLVWFVEMLVLTMLMLYPVCGKPYSPCCASNKFYSWWLDLEKREYEDWSVVLATCVSAAAPRPQQKCELGQRCSHLSLNLEPTFVGLPDPQDRISCIFLFAPQELRCIFPNQISLLSQML